MCDGMTYEEIEVSSTSVSVADACLISISCSVCRNNTRKTTQRGMMINSITGIEVESPTGTWLFGTSSPDSILEWSLTSCFQTRTRHSGAGTTRKYSRRLPPSRFAMSLCLFVSLIQKS